MKTQGTRTPRLRRRALTPWELSSLLTPVHRYRPKRPKKAKLRPHFPAVLNFVGRNRLVVANQVRRRFATQLRSDRTTRRHLEEMETLGLLGVAATRNRTSIPLRKAA